MSLRRLRELSGLPKAKLDESARARMVNGCWTSMDGKYCDGDAITYNGQSWNIEWEAGKPLNDDGTITAGEWWAVGDDGDEFEFEPGMEDRHDPMNER